MKFDPARSFLEECIQADEWPTIIKKEVVLPGVSKILQKERFSGSWQEKTWSDYKK